MSYSLLIGGWLVYFLLHSVLAATSVKQAMNGLLGSGFRFYRLFYSLFATLGLIVLLMVNSNIPTTYFFESSGVVRYISLMLTTFGVMLIQVSFRQYKLKGFLGLAPEEATLRKSGILTWIRHPIYSGLILVTIGFFLFVPSLPTAISCGCILFYLPIGIYLEEKKMIAEFGQAYIDYRKEVPALVPRGSRFKQN